MTIRCFIAIELNDAAHRALERIQSRLRTEGLNDRSINWVRPENIHLTLKFLGDVTDADINSVCQAVSATAVEFLPFDFEIGSIGCFPPGGPARVLWAGVMAGADLIEPLQKKLDERLHELGYPLENRRFSPHMTMARIKNSQVGYAVREVVEQFSVPMIKSQSVERLTVFQSELSRGGPTYTALHHADGRG
jgi:RNA 2',3'-cyclic 3'-phosphodiesterase